MTAVSRTTGATIVSLLGTIGSVANTTEKIINSAASSVDMLDAYVQKAKREQVAQHKIDEESWLENLLDAAARDHEKRQEAIIKEYASDSRRQQNFLAIRARLEAKLKPSAS